MATWASKLVPTGMPLRGPDMKVDMRPGAVSEKSAGSEGSEPLACAGRQARPVQSRVSPRPRGARFAGRRWWLVRPEEVAGSGADPAPGAGRLVAGSEESSKLASSLVLRFPATLAHER